MRMTTLQQAEDMGLGTSPQVGSDKPHQEGAMPVQQQRSTDDVVKMGSLRKFKGKKKWFVVRGESESGAARLEYYGKERHFQLGQLPRRTIFLKACFNINKTECKVKYVLALHTHNDCLRIVFNSEEDMKEWLQLLNSLAGSEEEEASEDVPSKLHFEHVWLVHALNKGLGAKEGIVGPYRLCLTSRELTLLKVGDGDERNSILKFPLNVIRSVSHDSTFGCFFHIEFGRSAVTGPGQLSLRTEDNNIAGNMHLLILKAMQNYSAVHSEVPRRGRTYTWNSGYSESSRPPSFVSQTPPVMTRIHSVDSGIPRNRTESMTSTDSRSGSSPPISISLSHQTPPTISFHSPLLYSTTDSASSSYSVDYENNNDGETRAREEEQDSYVPWHPSEEPTLSLPLQPLDTADYVTTGGQRLGSGAPSYMQMDLQSPTLYDNYLPMSPGSALVPGGSGSGKISVSHSRNSSLIEDIEGYVPMVPGQQVSTPMTNGGVGMGSASNIDSSYIEMDLSGSSRRKLNLSNEDRSLVESSVESLQSRTPSSDFPLEKVSSYFLPSDDLDDSGTRAVRAYSVGSRSDTGAAKGRFGKNRLEAVQESFRIRALSVGSKNPRGSKAMNLFSPPPLTPPNSSAHSSTSSVSTGGPQLSSSWSGSTGRWAQIRSQMSPATSQSHHNSEHGDSDLMELDFSHNRDKKPGRRNSLSGIREQSITTSSSSSKTPSPATGDPYMSMHLGGESSKYTSSAPISIQKAIGENMIGGGAGGSGPLHARMTGLDLNPLQSKDEYMSMDFAPVVAKTLANPVSPAPFIPTLSTTTQDSPSGTTTLSMSQQPLSRIEECLQESWGGRSRRATGGTIEEETTLPSSSSITYADVETGRSGTQPLIPTSNPYPRLSYPAVNYSQIDFKKSPK